MLCWLQREVLAWLLDMPQDYYLLMQSAVLAMSPCITRTSAESCLRSSTAFAPDCDHHPCLCSPLPPVKQVEQDRFVVRPLSTMVGGEMYEEEEEAAAGRRAPPKRTATQVAYRVTPLLRAQQHKADLAAERCVCKEGG